jgi:IclR family pca regulon transcriptional regulator
VILAQLPRDQQVAVLEARPRRKLTPATLTSLEALLNRLDAVKRNGFALADQENVSGLRVLAAPVIDADGVPVAGLSVAAPAFATTLTAFERSARTPVMAAARTLSKAIQAAGGVAAPARLPAIA